MTSDFTGSVVAGQFEASKRIGKGHFGSVYLCKNKILGYNSAVKIIPISGKNKDSAAIEAKLLAISQHGHIVNVRSASFWDDGIGNNYFIIEMEYVDGGSLEDAIKLNVSIGDVLSTIKNVLFAIAHVHSDVVHRDIKPANILMGGGGKLTDFGIAMAVSTGDMASGLNYNFNLAPECYAPRYLFDAKTDVFAAGLTLFRAMSLIRDWRSQVRGVSNWQAKMVSGGLIKKIGYHPRVPDKIRKIINRACNPDPIKRYTSALDFRDALEAVRLIRDWKYINPSTWACEYDGAEEVIAISVLKNAFEVTYTRSGRKKAIYTRRFGSFRDAENYLYSIISNTSVV